MTSSTNAKLILIDGYGFLFRAYYALPPLTRKDGMPVGAVLGFCNMLTKRLERFYGQKVIAIFDAKGPTFRNDIFPEYKANRDAPPEDLIPQFPLIRAAAAAFNLPCVELNGFEADDLIAAYTKQASAVGMSVEILSSDKDLMQLVSETVTMRDPIKNKTIDIAAVHEKFGVGPENVVDVQALAGDSTDNIPGVAGIGIKTAALLINEYGDLETLLERAGEIKQNKRRERLIDQADMARLSLKLVTLDQDTPLPLGIDEVEAYEPEAEKLMGFINTQEFIKLRARLEKVLSGKRQVNPVSETTPQADPAQIATHYRLITDLKDLEAVIDQARSQGFLAIDTETDSLTPATATLVGVSLSAAAGQAVYIPLNHVSAPEGELALAPERAENQLPQEAVLGLLKPLLEDPAVLKIGQNIKYDMQVFAQHDIHLSPIEDTMLISYVLDGGKHGHGLDELCRLHFTHNTIPYKDIAGTGKAQVTLDRVAPEAVRDYACEDADYCLRLWQRLKPRLVQEHGLTVYERLERPLAPIIAAMEHRGVRIDAAALKAMSDEFAAELSALEAKIHAAAGHEFNVASPKQVGEVLFDSMCLQGGKKTKTGAWSTNVEVLEKLALEGHTIVEDILEHRGLAKLKSTYADALVDKIDSRTSRVHTSFALAVTNTGRLSSSDPNLQNIPIRTARGRRIRQAFVPAEGYMLLSLDYSQVELRLAAQMAGIPAMKEAFAEGVDIHALTASQVFDIPLDEMTPERRRAAKAINFGIVYGISAFGLAKQLNIPRSDAADYINAYKARFPELDSFMEGSIAYARQHGYVETLFGRRCYAADINAKNGARRQYAERQAINAPLQGTAADIMKRAMVRVGAWLEQTEYDVHMLLQVHDELLFEVKPDEAETAAKEIQAIMEQAAGDRLDLPLKVEYGIGANWDAAH